MCSRTHYIGLLWAAALMATAEAQAKEDDFQPVSVLERQPCITDAPFKTVDQADQGMSPSELVLGVAINGEAVAYPYTALEQERVVNDTVGGTGI